jgi:uncharacterized membrane protein YfcA
MGFGMVTSEYAPFLNMHDILWLSVLFFIAALLYSSVGHAGASGYIAAMALFGLAPAVIKPTALFLNILVALIATVQFYRAGHFSWKIFWPLALGSIPFAFLGGALSLPTTIYKQIVGLVLLFAAYRLFMYTKVVVKTNTKSLSVGLAILLGAGIGFLSGLTGVGGGIFLSPLLLLMGWSAMKQTAAISAAFILVNSIAGLAGNYASVQFLPSALPFWAAAALIGGFIGSRFGSAQAQPEVIRRLLSVVLLIAGLKLIFT